MDKYLQDYLLSKYRHIFDKGIHIRCNNGWFSLIDNTLNCIYSYQKNNKKEFIKINTIKEKFGVLSIYHQCGDDTIHGMSLLSTYLSSNTCEFCGSTDNVGKTQGWIYTVCKKCYDNNEYNDFIRYEWKPNNDDRLLKLNKIKNKI